MTTWRQREGKQCSSRCCSLLLLFAIRGEVQMEVGQKRWFLFSAFSLFLRCFGALRAIRDVVPLAAHRGVIMSCHVLIDQKEISRSYSYRTELSSTFISVLSLYRADAFVN